MKKRNNDERCCGSCIWFKHEGTDGCGICYGHGRHFEHNGKSDFDGCCRCDEKPCKDFVSIGQMRHFRAVLLRCNRWRRDNNVPSIYRMPDPKEVGKAIDFALEYMKVFSEM